jgi:hypothetical protein
MTSRAGRGAMGTGPRGRCADTSYHRYHRSCCARPPDVDAGGAVLFFSWDGVTTVISGPVASRCPLQSPRVLHGGERGSRWTNHRAPRSWAFPVSLRSRQSGVGQKSLSFFFFFPLLFLFSFYLLSRSRRQRGTCTLARSMIIIIPRPSAPPPAESRPLE